MVKTAGGLTAILAVVFLSIGFMVHDLTGSLHIAALIAGVVDGLTALLTLATEA